MLVYTWGRISYSSSHSHRLKLYKCSSNIPLLPAGWSIADHSPRWNHGFPTSIYHVYPRRCSTSHYLAIDNDWFIVDKHADFVLKPSDFHGFSTVFGHKTLCRSSIAKEKPIRWRSTPAALICWTWQRLGKTMGKPCWTNPNQSNHHVWLMNSMKCHGKTMEHLGKHGKFWRNFLGVYSLAYYGWKPTIDLISRNIRLWLVNSKCRMGLYINPNDLL